MQFAEVEHQMISIKPTFHSGLCFVIKNGLWFTIVNETKYSDKSTI